MTDVELAEEGVRAAMTAGATAADVMVAGGDSTYVALREGEIEHVEHSNSRVVSVRAFRGTRIGIAYTNDATREGAAGAAARAAALAEIAAEDEAAGLPDPGDAGACEGEFDLVDAGHTEWTPDSWAALAASAERAARENDSVTHVEAARAGGGVSTIAIANSNGFSGARVRTSCALGIGLFATEESGDRQRGDEYRSGVHLEDLPSPEQIGRLSAQRAELACNSTKPPAGRVPVVFDPRVSRDFAGTLAAAVNAEAVYRRQTFLAGRLGEVVASPAVTLMDDATLHRRPASRPFDGEGVRSRRTVLIDAGRLSSWMADSYSARRAECRTTGNGRRGSSRGPSVGPSNLVLAPGEREPAEIIGDVDEGLYVTQLFGFGVNLAAGSFSRGGTGRWIRNGELTHAVSEFTIAGDLRDILKGVTECGSDLDWNGSTAAPTIRIDGLTVASG